MTSQQLQTEGAPSEDKVSAPRTGWLSPRAAFVLAFILTLSFPVVPRFATVVLFGVALGIILISALVSFKQNGTLKPAVEAILPDRSLFLPTLLLTAWCTLACLWSADPSGGAVKVLLLAGLILVSLTLTYTLSWIGDVTGKAMVTGFVAAMAVAAIYIAFDSVTHRSLHEFVVKSIPMLRESYHKHLKITHDGSFVISTANINRSTMILGLLFVPAVYGAFSLRNTVMRRLVLSIFAVSAALILIFTDHQSTQLAFAVGLPVFLIALYRPVFARRGLMLGWIGVLVLVVPMMLMAHRLDLHHADGLSRSARARIIIWNFTAHRVLDNWFTGVGTNATRALDRARKSESVLKPGEAAKAQTRAHPHSVFMHVWYELGIVGVFLFGWFGVALLRWTTQLGRLEPVMLTQLAVSAAMMAASYGMWQTWFQVGLASGVLATLAGGRLLSGRGT